MGLALWRLAAIHEKLLRRFVTAVSDAKDVKSIYDFLLIAHKIKIEKIIKVD